MENTESNNVDDASFEPVSTEPASPSRSERQWAMGCHLIALVPFPSANLLGPLILWLIKREDGAFKGWFGDVYGTALACLTLGTGSGKLAHFEAGGEPVQAKNRWSLPKLWQSRKAIGDENPLATVES